ncbi:energy-dependent translational throttle protein EttA [Mycobacterium sp. 155]|uniref:energy-dependent translational throttle protein EttA n=1 Tax=Mycobacterium sp. 155 TaxID=1157943 RepID=UPI00035FCF9C|nr:energy-dependent translational throttle protein EttA [Mycobacterium sp. 155]
MRWIYQLNEARVVRGEKVVLDDVTFSLTPGAKVGVIGPNGAGKSTLLAVLAGHERTAQGDARPAPGISTGLLAQEPVLDNDKTVVGNVRDAVASIEALLTRYHDVAARLALDFDNELIAELGALQEQLDVSGAWDLDSRLEQAMEALRCPPPDMPVRCLSGGQRRRVALCRLLIARPDLLLLDEPTNHLDAESVHWLERHLAAYPGTVVAVTHDRYFLDNVAQWILELDRGRVDFYQGNYAAYLTAKTSRLQVQGRKDAKQLRQLQRELDWVRFDHTARQTHSSDRLRRYEQMSAAGPRHADFDGIRITPGPRLGSSVIEVDHLRKSIDGRELFADLSFTLPRNGIVGVVGPNGVGKTTLFQILSGNLMPDAGSVKIGESVRIAYVDQDRAHINPASSAWEVVSGGHDVLQIGGCEVNSRAYLATFGFRGPGQQKPARLFSGGERNRLNLALTLKVGGNVLLLDEPTNDLDIDTLSSLEDAIGEFAGCVVVSAHDRWFLDRVATHILAWETTETGQVQWYWCEGNFEKYEEDKVARLGQQAINPIAGTHRRLGRD